MLLTLRKPRPSLLARVTGDDLTHEDGFKVVQAHGAVSIFVGQSGRNTAARYFLSSPICSWNDYAKRLIGLGSTGVFVESPTLTD